jgi:signal transduction histidine kinase
VGVLVLGVLVGAAVARLARGGGGAGAAITVVGARATTVIADDSKLRQVIHNLLGNAVEAARDPAAGAATVDIGWRAAGGAVVLAIEDRGAGVSAAAKPRLFEPFFTTRPRGHGLGLAIARSLARAHGGDVELRDRSGGGTVATVTLPERSAEVPR